MPPIKRGNIWERRASALKHSDRQYGTKGSNLRSGHKYPWVLLSAVCNGKKGWGPQADNKPKETKPILETTAFHGGKHKHAPGHPAWGLRDQSRCKRCLLYGAGKQKKKNIRI